MFLSQRVYVFLLELGLSSIFWSLSLIGSTFNSVAGTCCTTVHTKFHGILQSFVPATCPLKFNKLNCVRHVAGTKYPRNWCCIIIKVSVYTRGHVAATYPWDMYPQQFHVCANVVILSLLHVHATRPCYMWSQCVLHKFFVAATCRCDMSLQHDPSCLPTYSLPSIQLH